MLLSKTERPIFTKGTFSLISFYIYNQSLRTERKIGEIENCELFNMPIFTIIKGVDQEEGGFM